MKYVFFEQCNFIISRTVCVIFRLQLSCVVCIQSNCRSKEPLILLHWRNENGCTLWRRTQVANRRETWRYWWPRILKVNNTNIFGVDAFRLKKVLQGSQRNLETWKTWIFEFYLSRSRNSLEFAPNSKKTWPKQEIEQKMLRYTCQIFRQFFSSFVLLWF